MHQDWERVILRKKKPKTATNRTDRPPASAKIKISSREFRLVLMKARAAMKEMALARRAAEEQEQQGQHQEQNLLLQTD